MYSEDLEGTNGVEVRPLLTTGKLDDAVFENTVSRLGLERGVTAVPWGRFPIMTLSCSGLADEGCLLE
ncbi:hypothetical protein FEF26_03835 [Nesterenkonia salmonea]|uniref:MgtC-like C-terminal domain-containing protein n=1 Tax=Nesterenkonia salmonea TaxID=1804987 RepID=A0A5R9BFG6_9MICC|nr:hypothetical protein [Nesterenkonia salmonea]TLP98852.1 hypothetical protein FEF26_03835 [Nesterenkonia salmonea]